MKNVFKALHVSIAFLSVAILACAVFWIFAEPQTQAAMSVDIHGHSLKLEVVQSALDLAKGLGNRASLDRNAGMLFVLPYRGIHSFWMKGMEFPLDIIWLDRGKVTDMVTLDPPTEQNPTPQIYTPHLSADRVLEINAGQAARFGLKAGDTVELPR